MGNTGIYDTGVRPAIDKHLLELAQQRRDYGKYWSASSAGYCMRKVIFDRLQVPQTREDARKQRVFTSGHIFHDWIQGITKAAGVSVAQEVELTDETIMVKGHFDDLVLISEISEMCDTCGGSGIGSSGDPMTECFDCKDGRDEHLILYDYKTQNSRAFSWQKKQGTGMSYFHRLQLGTYMYMLRKKDIYREPGFPKYDGKKYQYKDHDLSNLEEARILKISKDDLRMSEELLFWDDQLEEDVLGYWDTLNDYWAKKKLPPCTCADHEGGFMSKPQYNPYHYNDESCSLEWYAKCKAEGLIKDAHDD